LSAEKETKEAKSTRTSIRTGERRKKPIREERSELYPAEKKVGWKGISVILNK